MTKLNTAARLVCVPCNRLWDSVITAIVYVIFSLHTHPGETSATSVQTSSGTGQQTNQGEASAVSVQQQTGLGGATQVTNNQGVINALQQASGGAGGGGGGSQSFDREVSIQPTQLPQNVIGTLVNVHDGNQGIVIINTNDVGETVGELECYQKIR